MSKTTKPQLFNDLSPEEQETYFDRYESKRIQGLIACGSCRYWKPIKAWADVLVREGGPDEGDFECGECRRNAPVGGAEYAKTDAAYWCGQGAALISIDHVNPHWPLHCEDCYFYDESHCHKDGLRRQVSPKRYGCLHGVKMYD